MVCVMDEKKAIWCLKCKVTLDILNAVFSLKKKICSNTQFEYTIMYLNQSRISYKGSKKIYYAEYFVLRQILERSDSPKNLEDVVLGEWDVSLIHPRYNINSGKFERGFREGIKMRYF